MKVNLNRGLVIFSSIIAGLIIGLFAGGYIYYAWMPTEMVLKDAPPRVLFHDDAGNTPQYRDFYAARVANVYQRETQANVADAIQHAYNMLGVTTGDATQEQAIAIVRQAADVARLENQRDGDLGYFTQNDELALTTLADALQAQTDTGKQLIVDTSTTAPAIARNTARAVGFAILIVLAALLGTVIFLIDRRSSGLSSNPATPSFLKARVSTQTSIQQDSVIKLDEPAQATTTEPDPVTASNASVARTPTAPILTTADTVAAPITAFGPTTFRHGDDHYDEDFAINGPMGELIGECGASIADRLGLDTPARVSALALWVFDKNDFQSTTKVLMTDYAYNDPVIRAKLKARGEPVLAAQNSKVEIITSSLRVEVQITGLELNNDNNPPNGYFQNVTLTYAVFKSQPAA